MTSTVLAWDTERVPRRPPRDDAGPDEWAAWRIGFERERLGLSQGELARRVSAAGTPMQQQAVWKIENGQPPRRVSFGEAVAFCEVFGIEDVADLGRRPEKVAREYVAEVRRRLRDWSDDTRSLIEQLQALREHAEGDPEVWLGLIGDIASELDVIAEVRERVAEVEQGEPRQDAAARS